VAIVAIETAKSKAHAEVADIFLCTLVSIIARVTIELVDTTLLRIAGIVGAGVLIIAIH